jgi:hypothetical protein
MRTYVLHTYAHTYTHTHTYVQVEVTAWDENSEIWFQVFLENGAPSTSFTVVCYQMGDAFDTWKWYAHILAHAHILHVKMVPQALHSR